MAIGDVIKRLQEKGVEKIPYSERVVLLPQCLRSNKCQAEKKQFGQLVCKQCMQKRDDGSECPIPDMIAIAKETGYRDVYMVTGGSGIVKLLESNGKPKAVLGVACQMELEEGHKAMKKIGVKSQAEELLKSGCAETTCFKDMKNFKEEWKQMLRRLEPE